MNCYNTNCPICFNKPENNDIIIRTSCKHFICLKCLNEGGFQIRTCPMCRRELIKAYVCTYSNNKPLIVLEEGKCCPCPDCIGKKMIEIQKMSKNEKKIDLRKY